MLVVSKKPIIKELTIKKFSALGKSWGKIVVRHKEMGLHKNVHLVDKLYVLWNVTGTIIAREQSATTGVFLWLVAYPIGVLTYKIAVWRKIIGDTILTSWKTVPNIGNTMVLLNIPLNIKICLIESYPGSGAIYARSAGAWATIVAKKKSLVKVLFKNGKIKYLNKNCLATIGRVSNVKKAAKKLKFAGDKRNRGARPRVRGVAKNAVDHPHGGGKGKKSKNSVPEPPWGRKYLKKKKNDKKFF